MNLTFLHFKLGYVFASGEYTHCFLFVSCILYKLTSENKRATLTFRIVKRSYSPHVHLFGVRNKNFCQGNLSACSKSIVRMWL